MNQISVLLEKVKNVDSDYRYMGLNDLHVLIASPSFQLSPEVESRLVPVVLETLGDTNAEVQNVAVKTYSYLFPPPYFHVRRIIIIYF
jgi:hypothetical protein